MKKFEIKKPTKQERQIKRIENEIQRYKLKTDEITQMICKRKGIENTGNWSKPTLNLENCTTEELEELRQGINEHISDLTEKKNNIGIAKFFQFAQENFEDENKQIIY
jgi:hypothetical protein